MSKIYLPSHKDCWNRGCEAITEGTAKILGDDKISMVAYSSDIESDKLCGIDRYVCLKPIPQQNIVDDLIFKIKKRLIKDVSDLGLYKIGHIYNKILRKICRHDVVLSTGGDMLCYDNNEIIYINNFLHKKGVKQFCGVVRWEKRILLVKRPRFWGDLLRVLGLNAKVKRCL